MKFFILLLILSFPAFAQNCAPVNYLTQANSPFDKIPVADQDGTGICYAYTSAQLVDYHLLRTRQTRERVIHPAWVALKASRRYLDEGYAHHAISALRQNANCSYDYVETALNVHGLRARLEGSPLVAFLEAYAREMQRQMRSSRNGITQDMVDRSYAFAIDNSAPFCDEEVLWEEMLPELANLQETSVQLFTRLLGNSCRADVLNRYNIPVPLFADNFQSNEQARFTLQDQVTKGPFTISYCSNTWDNSSYNGMVRPGNGSRDDCLMHSSLAVGRKQIGPHCYLLVRNSWGTGWGDWNANQTCICKNTTTGAWVDECNSTDHNDGEHTVEACYVGMNHLSRNLQDITTFYR